MEATERAANLTRQMLAYAGRGKFVLCPCDFSEVVRAMESLLASSVSKKCTLRYELAVGLPPLRADAGQLQQVVLNLVANASEALEEREGQVTLRTGTVTCRPQELNLLRPDGQAEEYPCVFLEVEDTGCGIRPGLQNRIFDPFFTTKFIGRGLSLPAVLGIVRRHQGAIKVRSEPGHGSVFRVLLPVAPPLVPQAVPAAGETGETVLVVDDEDSVRALARSALEAIGCTVLEAGDGVEALAVFRAHAGEIRLVLLDLAMPRLDGTEALRELRRLNPDVRVILNSGYEMDTPPPLPPGTGPVEFLQKPYRLEMLWDAVRRHLDP
jgi:CheY-like chemotaxis protein